MTLILLVSDISFTDFGKSSPNGSFVTGVGERAQLFYFIIQVIRFYKLTLFDINFIYRVSKKSWEGVTAE